MSADCLEPLALLDRLQNVEFGPTNIWNVNIEFDLWTLASADYINYSLYKPKGVDKCDFCWHFAKSLTLSPYHINNHVNLERRNNLRYAQCA